MSLLALSCRQSRILERDRRFTWTLLNPGFHSRLHSRLSFPAFIPDFHSWLSFPVFIPGFHFWLFLYFVYKSLMKSFKTGASHGQGLNFALSFNHQNHGFNVWLFLFSVQKSLLKSLRPRFISGFFFLGPKKVRWHNNYHCITYIDNANINLNTLKAKDSIINLDKTFFFIN